MMRRLALLALIASMALDAGAFTFPNSTAANDPWTDENVAAIDTRFDQIEAGTSVAGRSAGVTSAAGDPADAGVVRLGNAETICWEASPTGTDACLTVDTSEALTFAGSVVSLLGATIAPTELASADFGSFTCNGTTCAIDSGAIVSAMLESAVTLDADVTTHCIEGGLLTPGDADDHYLGAYPFAITVTNVRCIASGGGTIAITMQECSSTGTSCGTTEAITCDSDGAADSGGIDDATVDADDYRRVLYAAPSGTVSDVTWTFCYTAPVVR